MIRVLFTFLLSIQYDSLLVVCMIHSNARQVVLLDVSSSVFMVDLKVNPNYKFCCGLWKWFHTSVLRGIAHLEYGAWVCWMASSHWDELLEETDSIWIWIRVYQLFELTIEQKTHDSYTCSSGIVNHENQHFYSTILRAWLLSLVKLDGSLHFEIMPSFQQQRWVFEGHFDLKVWVTPLNSNFSSTQNQMYDTYAKRKSIRVLKTLRWIHTQIWYEC